MPVGLTITYYIMAVLDSKDSSPFGKARSHDIEQKDKKRRDAKRRCNLGILSAEKHSFCVILC